MFGVGNEAAAAFAGDVVEGLRAQGVQVDEPAYEQRIVNEVALFALGRSLSQLRIVADQVAQWRGAGTVVGPGCGLTPGMLVAFGLRMTDVDPVAFNVVGERYVSSDRRTVVDLPFYVDALGYAHAIEALHGQGHHLLDIEDSVTFPTFAITTDAQRALAGSEVHVRVFTCVGLTITRLCLGAVERERGVRVDLSAVPLNDLDVFAALCEQAEHGSVWTTGEDAVADTLTLTGCSSIDDLAAVMSIVRPGPLNAGDDLQFAVRRALARSDQEQEIRRGEGVGAPTKRMLDDVLAETYGLIRYDDQAMQIVHHMTGWPLDRCDDTRRILARGRSAQVNDECALFLTAAAASGYRPADSQVVFSELMAASNLAFMKAACVGEAIARYRNAYLKVRYPTQFAAAMTALGDLLATPSG